MSSPEVTITLGHSGQVVKRKRANLEGASFSSDSKRQRDTAVKKNVGNDGLPLDRNDLRYKLIRRRLSSESRAAASGHHQREEVKGRFSGSPVRSFISSNALEHGTRSQGEAARDLPYGEPSRNHYCAVTRDDMRQRSPARPTHNSWCFSPPTYKTEMQKVTPIRSTNPIGSRRGHSNSLSGPPRSTVTAHVMGLTESERAKPVALISSPNGVMPRSFAAGASVTVAGLLNSLGLRKYAILFQAEEVDLTALKQMGEKDLKDLGIPMGPRKKILQALSILSKRQFPRQI